MNLGRYQRGDVVPLGLDTTDPPDATPTVALADPASAPLWTRPIGLAGNYHTFALALFVGDLALGTYTASYSWSLAGVPHTATDTFTVIGGGDVGGAILALRAYTRPEGQYVVTQLTSGKVVQGRNPRL